MKQPSKCVIESIFARNVAVYTIIGIKPAGKKELTLSPHTDPALGGNLAF